MADDSEADVAALWRRACDESHFTSLLPLPSTSGALSAASLAARQPAPAQADSSLASSSGASVLALGTRSGLLFHVLALPDAGPQADPHCWQLHLLEAVELSLPQELLARHKNFSLSLLPGVYELSYSVVYTTYFTLQ